MLLLQRYQTCVEMGENQVRRQREKRGREEEAGAGLAKTGYLRSGTLISLSVVRDEQPSAAPDFGPRVVHTARGSGWNRREARPGMRSELSTEQSDLGRRVGGAQNEYPSLGHHRHLRKGSGLDQGNTIVIYIAKDKQVCATGSLWRVRPDGCSPAAF